MDTQTRSVTETDSQRKIKFAWRCVHCVGLLLFAGSFIFYLLCGLVGVESKFAILVCFGLASLGMMTGALLHCIGYVATRPITYMTMIAAIFEFMLAILWIGLIAWCLVSGP